MQKRILVTGGAGFIGSHLCERLLKEGNKVIIIDNFNNFYDPLIKERNVKEIENMMQDNQISREKFSIYRVDFRDFAEVEPVFAENNIDLVIHLAAMAGVRPSINDPMLYTDVNIKGTVNLLELSRKYNVKKFIFASSSSVYGNNEKVPFSEDDNVDFPISPYASTKKAGELLCYTYHHLYDLSIACLRFFTVYGPRQRPDLAIHKFTDLIFKGEEIPFFGDGTTQRDYTYIDDIIDGVLKSVYWIFDGEPKYDIFNLGESRTISLRQMVETLENTIGKKAVFKKLPMQPGDVQRTYADISKAKRILGYNPTMGFEQGIESFIGWYKGVNGIE